MELASPSGFFAASSVLKVGIIVPNKGEHAGPESLDASARTAVELGWDSAWVTDHLFVPSGKEAAEYGSMLEALTTLTWISARQPSLSIGTSVIIPAWRDAPLLAKELATMDILSHGKLVVGVGVSDKGDIAEYTNLGKADRFSVRGAYLDESIELWRHLWSGNTDPFVGRFNELRDYNFLPLPPQRDKIPILAGGRSDLALARVARLADGYHAAQTGPADVAAKLPTLEAECNRLGRETAPTISVRARVRMGEEPIGVYSFCGTDDNMIRDAVEFAALGVNEIVVTFATSEPSELSQQMRKFHERVVAPTRELLARG
jgi:alkanesulfonate monooxygenase SsuD/methylene tetrahydromethanopterin reductase-like flavin-dependent oxidoreductase (luciferase family)